MDNKKGLSVFNLTMLALGTVVGGSFFLGSVIPIKNSGPSVVIAYLIGGVLVYFILFSLSEMAVVNPDVGSFRTYAEKAYGKGVGFVVGWVYFTGLVLAMSSEAVAVSILIRGWFPQLPLLLLGIIIIIFVTGLNLLGTEKLSKLESGLAAIKLLSIVGFIVISLYLIFGDKHVGLGTVRYEPIFPNGISGIAGSLLIVMFTYAGFEVIGLAASEVSNPIKKIPKAILFTVIGLLGLYITSILLLLPLIPTNKLSTDVSPFVAALQNNNILWGAKAINLILVTAILSTMLASTFGLARMFRSLASEGYAPNFLADKGDIPYKGIIISGLGMISAFLLSFLLPEHIYIFLVSSGGFSLLFTYLIIILTHYKFRKIHGCPKHKCQLPFYPFSSIISIILLLIIIISMPLIPGQGSGLIAGVGLVLLFTLLYFISKLMTKKIHNDKI